MVKTKIIATLGPSSSSACVIRKMMLAGLDVVRLNFSHGSLREHSRRIKIVRRLNRIYRRHIRILGDLEGPRIRIGVLKNHMPVELKKGEAFSLFRKGITGSLQGVSLDYEGPFEKIAKGKDIYIDDGTIALKVTASFRKEIRTTVVSPGILKERKGVNIPDVRLQFNGLSTKDKEDLEFAIENRLDYIAQSFVRRARDVEEIRESLRGRLTACKIIAKIENRQGIKNIDEIIDASDGVMVARGDMGVSIPIYEVPMVQKEIISKCNAMEKFVITATQMLEQMVTESLPTRAEVADVANAVLDGTDFVMLSEETAAGLYPVESVAMMNKIIEFTERSMHKVAS